MPFQTEYEFELPKGFIDTQGNMHKKGVMRLATAADEILPMRDPRVQQNPSYLSVILLSRVITKLGEVGHIDTKVVERLFTADLAYLQDLYQRINQMETPSYPTTCPKCGHEHETPVDFFNLRG